MTTEAILTRDLPDGRFVTFQESPRAYHLCDPANDKRTRCVSVTTALGVLNKPAVIRWAEAQGAAGVVRAIRMGEIDPMIHLPDEAIGIVRTLKLGADAAKDRAADRGLTIHDALQTYCNTSELPSPQDLAMDARPYLRGLSRALLALDPTPIHVERIVCHPELGYAGRLDLLAEVDGLRTLIDVKTSKSGRGYSEAHIQSVGYASAEQSVGEPWPDRIVVLGVSPDGEFCADDCTAPRDAFEKVLAVYRLLADVRRPLDAAARAAKKAAA
jgi:hypothetical protein